MKLVDFFFFSCYSISMIDLQLRNYKYSRLYKKPTAFIILFNFRKKIFNNFKKF